MAEAQHEEREMMWQKIEDGGHDAFVVDMTLYSSFATVRRYPRWHLERPFPFARFDLDRTLADAQRTRFLSVVKKGGVGAWRGDTDPVESP